MNSSTVTDVSHPVSLLPWGFSWVKDLCSFEWIAGQAKRSDISYEARRRLKWMDYFREKKDVTLTCRHFDISRKTFHKWKKRFNPRDLRSLEEIARTPKKKRQRELSVAQEARVVALRKKFIRLGKEKLAKLYESEYGEKISAWKIQKVIERKELYWNPKKVTQVTRKRLKGKKKRRTIELNPDQRKNLLLCLDTIVLYYRNMKLYIYTAIDHASKVAFARVYKSKASRNSKDFLTRLMYLWGKKIRIANDNGS